MFAEHERRLRHADVFRLHDFVCAAVFEHAVLMDARFVRECVAADDRLVRLHLLAGYAAQQLARRKQLGCVD